VAAECDIIFHGDTEWPEKIPSQAHFQLELRRCRLQTFRLKTKYMTHALWQQYLSFSLSERKVRHF